MHREGPLHHIVSLEDWEMEHLMVSKITRRERRHKMLHALEQWSVVGELSAFVLFYSNGRAAQFAWINEHAFGVRRRLVIVSENV
jgi:hypothetical protein